MTAWRIEYYDVIKERSFCMFVATDDYKRAVKAAIFRGFWPILGIKKVSFEANFNPPYRL